MTPNPNKTSYIHADFMLLIVLGAIGAVTPFAIDMYLPAMPSIAFELNVSAGAVQNTLTAYMGGFAIGQVIHGPLSDSYGRKPVIVGGLLLFVVGAIVCASVSDIHELLMVRFVQGFAGATAAVVIQAVVRDMFDREEFSRIMSFITLIISVAPLIAPMLGGHFAIWFGWRSIFWFLAIFAIIVVVMVVWKIPETLAAEHRQSLHLRSILRNYFKLLCSLKAFGLMFCGACSFAGLFAFLTAGPFVYIQLFGVSTEAFGYLLGVNVIAMIVMTSINSKLVRRVGSHMMLRFGLCVHCSAGLFLVFAGICELGLWGFVPGIALLIGSIATIGSNSMAILLSGYPKMAGTASSLAGILRFGLASVIGVIVAAFPDDSYWPMIAAMAVCGVCSVGFYWLLGRKA